MIDQALERIKELESENEQLHATIADQHQELADCYDRINEIGEELRSAKGQLSQIRIDRRVVIA